MAVIYGRCSLLLSDINLTLHSHSGLQRGSGAPPAPALHTPSAPGSSSGTGPRPAFPSGFTAGQGGRETSASPKAGRCSQGHSARCASARGRCCCQVWVELTLCCNADKSGLLLCQVYCCGAALCWVQLCLAPSAVPRAATVTANRVCSDRCHWQQSMPFAMTQRRLQ